MPTINQQFIIDSKTSCENQEAKKIRLKNLNHFYKKFETGTNIFSNLKLAKETIHYNKYKAIENIEKLLIEFETKFINRGGKIFYAKDKDDACSYIHKIIKNQDTKKVLKSKSMVCEEIELEKFLKEQKVEILETDLGEFIVQLANEKPSHITAPALHKSKEQIYELLNEKFDQTFNINNTSPETVVRFIRNYLREEFGKSDVGITGCNFIIPEIGAVSISENEANSILSFSYPKIHIIVSSIEKLIPSLKSLELFQTMLATHATGQKITAYNHIVFGPKKQDETNGPEQVHLVLVDNGRTKIMEKVNMREAMYCIKCGACHNFCPVYKQIGGHAYNTVYNGPIGKFISPFLFGEKEYQHLAFSSTLCGKCNDVCPANINITSLLLLKRKQIVDKKLNSKNERRLFGIMYKNLRKRKRLNRYSPFLKNTALRLLIGKNWGQYKTMPIFQKQSFNQIKKQKKKQEGKN